MTTLIVRIRTQLLSHCNFDKCERFFVPLFKMTVLTLSGLLGAGLLEAVTSLLVDATTDIAQKLVDTVLCKR